MKRILAVLLILLLSLPLASLADGLNDPSDPGKVDPGNPIIVIPGNQGDPNEKDPKEPAVDPNALIDVGVTLPELPAGETPIAQTECPHAVTAETPSGTSADGKLLYERRCVDCGALLSTAARAVDLSEESLNLGGYGELTRTGGNAQGVLFSIDGGPQINLNGFSGLLEVGKKSQQALSLNVASSDLTLRLHTEKVYENLAGTPDSRVAIDGGRATVRNAENFRGTFELTGGADVTLRGNVGAGRVSVDQGAILRLDDGIAIEADIDNRGVVTVGGKPVQGFAGAPDIADESAGSGNGTGALDTPAGTDPASQGQAGTDAQPAGQNDGHGLLQQGGKAVFTVGERQCAVNGQTVEMEDASFVYGADDGFTMVPARMLGVLFGEKNVLYGQGTITLFIGHHTITLKAGSNVATVNGADIAMGCPVVDQNGRVFLPLSQIANILSMRAAFDADTQTFTLGQ